MAERGDIRVGNCHWLDSKSADAASSPPILASPTFFTAAPFRRHRHLFQRRIRRLCPTGDWPVCQPLPVQHEMGKEEKTRVKSVRHEMGNDIEISIKMGNDIEAEIPIC